MLNYTGEEIRCDGYIKGKNSMEGPVLPIVSAATYVKLENEESFIMVVHQACYNSDVEQHESLCLPYQAEQHGVTFDLTPRHRTNARGENGKQIMKIGDRMIPLEFDGLKMFINIRRPTNKEMDELPILELTADVPFQPDSADDHDNIVTNRRKEIKKIEYDSPGNIPLAEWRKRLAFAPEDVVRKTFLATTQLATNVEAENRVSGRRHFKSRFNYLKEKRINDIFHSDTFFPTIRTNSGDTCSQLFIGRNTDFMKVYPLKKESHSFRALQDFSRSVGLPKGIKTDNATAETGSKWTNFCRDFKIDTTYTEPHSPWQNYAEHGIGNLGRMVTRCMKIFKVPLDRHHWCQRWCCDVRNHLASRKLNWRTPQEKISGETPDISVFRFHFWQEVEYYDPTCKQPESGWIPARFLGIAWDSGDFMTYYIETRSKTNRATVLVRSTVRTRSPLLNLFPDSSGETLRNTNDNIEDQALDNEASGENDANLEDDNLSTWYEDETRNEQTPEPQIHEVSETNQGQSRKENLIIDPGELQTGISQPVNNIASDDAYTDPTYECDDSCVHEQLINDIDNDVEDMEFDYIKSYQWLDGVLVFNIVLTSGKDYDIPFDIIKKDRPLETAKYILNHVLENKRNGRYSQWAKTVIKQSHRTIRRLSRSYNVDRAIRHRRNSHTSIIMRRI